MPLTTEALSGSRTVAAKGPRARHQPRFSIHASQSARRALPHGVPPLAPSKSAWLTAAEADPRILAMRADRRRNVLSAARILGWTARDGTARPTRSRTAARMAVSTRTVSKLWRVLEQLGYLACVEQ